MDEYRSMFLKCINFKFRGRLSKESESIFFSQFAFVTSGGKMLKVAFITCLFAHSAVSSPVQEKRPKQFGAISEQVVESGIDKFVDLITNSDNFESNLERVVQGIGEGSLAKIAIGSLGLIPKPLQNGFVNYVTQTNLQAHGKLNNTQNATLTAEQLTTTAEPISPPEVVVETPRTTPKYVYSTTERYTTRKPTKKVSLVDKEEEEEEEEEEDHKDDPQDDDSDSDESKEDQEVKQKTKEELLLLNNNLFLVETKPVKDKKKEQEDESDEDEPEKEEKDELDKEVEADDDIEDIDDRKRSKF